MSNKNRAAALAAAQSAEGQAASGEQEAQQSTQQPGEAGAEGTAGDAAAAAAEGAQAPAAEGTGEGVAEGQAAASAQEGAKDAAEPVVTNTATTLQEAAVGTSRGTIAPPRVKRADDGVVKTAPVAPSTLKATAAVQAGPNLKDEMERICPDVPSINRFPILQVIEYCTKADLKRSNDVQTLARLNVNLWNNISNLINKQDEHFEQLFTCLLRIFVLEGKNSLSEIAINRGVEHMALTGPELQGYYNITTLLRLTADPKSRAQVLKTAINLPKALKNGLSQEGISRVVTYFETH